MILAGLVGTKRGRNTEIYGLRKPLKKHVSLSSTGREWQVARCLKGLTCISVDKTHSNVKLV